ncbi:MAG: ABC transporter substrate-binding protein [Nostoc sp.]|uniref:ABC transporter substrate-binding protein n=1 Tax=Nostoc sp. TaxID=1180 RepID=UPI002FFAE26E
MTANPTKGKKSLPPIVYILATFLLIAGASLGDRKILNSLLGNSININHDLAKDAISKGETLFFPEDGTSSKLRAAEAFTSGNYATAQALFDQSLQQKPNDPEALIYSNNAKASLHNPLEIAVCVPGNADSNGSREILRGVAQAQQEINAIGGIKGRLLRVKIANDNNDNNSAQQIATSFVNQSSILGVVGHYASGVTLATADTYNRGKLVAISPISSAVQLSNKSAYVFRTVPSDYVSARALVDYMLQTLKLKKAVVYFNSQSDYSKSLKGEFSTAIALQGGQVVGEYDLANSSHSHNQSLEAAKQRGAEVIMLASNTGSLDRALQVVQANNNHLPVLGGDDVYSPKTLDVTREQGRDMVVAVPWHILATGSKDFAQRSRRLWGGDVNWRTATAYDATQALGAALRQNPTREGIQLVLHSPSFVASGASRTVSFLPSGDRNAPVQLVKVIQGGRSTYGYDFIPIP